MKRWLRIAAVLVCLLLTTVTLVHADFGDYGGDYDYGGGGGYDYDSGGNDYDYDYDDRDSGDNYYYGGSSSSSSGGGRDSLYGGIVFLAVVALVVFLVVRKNKGKGTTANRPVMPGAQRTDPATLRSLGEYRQIDPNFSEDALKEKVSNLYVQFQNAWQAKDLSTLRPYLTDAFYARVDRQLDAYRRNHQTNRIERIAVLGVEPVGFKQENGSDLIVVTLRTRIVDYVTDDATGNIVRGSNTAEKFMEYEWTLTRSSAAKTGDANGTTAQNCPNCGAPIDINKTAKCEYCGSIITTDAFDWAVSEIKGLSQRTGN